MERSLAGLLPVLVLLAGAPAPVAAETLADLLTSRGLPPPAAGRAEVDAEPLRTYQVLDDERDVLVVYVTGAGDSTRLHAARWERASKAWTRATLQWSAGGGALALEAAWCRSSLALGRAPGGFVVTAHINPSAECTIVLGEDLSVRAVLAGWPVVTLADGRIVYQRNQVHFAAVHPVALALFDPRGPGDVTLYPRAPRQKIRREHVARMRATYTATWCNVHNHPCDPERFDEHVAGPVVADARGEALAFVMAWDNTTGWSDAERWGRLEAFRELRAATAGWDGLGDPPASLFRALSAGLARTRNLGGGAHVAAALSGEPALRDLVAAALAAPRAPGQDEQSWLMAQDARWGEAETWRRLGRAVQVPAEFTEVVYVYEGLGRPETTTYREILRADFEARYGSGAPGRALEPDVRRRIFQAAPE
jgi:hypothetical protein